MNEAFSAASDPAEMRIVGSFRLSQAIFEAVSTKRSVQDACTFMLELLPYLFDAKAISIQVAYENSLTEYEVPLDFCAARAGGDTEISEVATPLIFLGKTYGRIRLYVPLGACEMGPQGRALLDFAGSCLARIVYESGGVASVLASLTPAERKVLSLFAVPTDQILEALHISRETFRVHCKHIYKKLGVHTRQDALEMARQCRSMEGFPEAAPFLSTNQQTS